MTKYKLRSRKLGINKKAENVQEISKEITTEVAHSNRTVKNAFLSDYKSIENGVVGAYKKIESGVVNSYKMIEDAVVGTYKKIEGKFVEQFLEERPEDTSNENN